METTLATIIYFGSIVPAIATVNACYRAVLKITGSSGMFYSMKQKFMWYFVAWMLYVGVIGAIFGFSSPNTTSEQNTESTHNSATNQTQTQTQTPAVSPNQQPIDSLTEPMITTPEVEPKPYVAATSPAEEETITAKYYDLSLASQEFHHLEIPDFIYFATEGEFYTQATDIMVDSTSLRVQFFYEREFSTSISAYAFYLNDLGFISDNSTSIYTVTKEVSGYILSVAAWAMSEPECVVVNISLTEGQNNASSSSNIGFSHQLEGEAIENQVTEIRNLYNEIMEHYANDSYNYTSLGDGVTAYSDGLTHDLRYVQVARGYNQVDYARHYYFNEGELIFLYKEGGDSYRLYFYQGKLFRNRYTDTYGNATNFEYDNTDSYLYLENFALAESEFIQNLA